MTRPSTIGLALLSWGIGGVAGWVAAGSDDSANPVLRSLRDAGEAVAGRNPAIVGGSGAGAVDDEEARRLFLADSDAFIGWLAGLPPLERNSQITKLVEDSDLIFAQRLLDSSLWSGLPDDLLAAVATSALSEDVIRFCDWMEGVANSHPDRVVALLEEPVFQGIHDPKSLTRLVDVYLGAAGDGTGFNSSNLTMMLGWAITVGGEDAIREVLSGKLRFVPTGPYAATLARTFGRMAPDAGHLRGENVPTEIRRAFLVGAAEAGADPPDASSPDRSAWVEGRLRFLLSRPSLPAVELSPILHERLQSVEDGEVAGLAKEIFNSTADPGSLLPLLLDETVPAARRLFSEVFSQYVRLDPVVASEALADLPVVPDEAVKQLISEIRNDPEAALLWANRLQDPSERREAIERFLPELEKVDPDRAATLRSVLDGYGSTVR